MSSLATAAAFTGRPADPAGIERTIAQRMPAIMVGAIGVLGIAWWMAAQPPPGPGWNDPNGPQQQYPPGQPPPAPPPTQSSASSACAGADCGDCATAIDCGDCVSGLDCGDCAGLDCGDCSGLDCSCTLANPRAIANASATPSDVLASPTSGAKPCSARGWKRLARSSGLLLPLFVLIGWRRRIRR